MAGVRHGLSPARVMTFLTLGGTRAEKVFRSFNRFSVCTTAGFRVGLGNGKEKLFFLPEAHNDFIFAVIGEELGFLGIVAVVLAYLYFIYSGLRIAWNCQKYHQISSGCCLPRGLLSRSGFKAS